VNLPNKGANSLNYFLYFHQGKLELYLTCSCLGELLLER